MVQFEIERGYNHTFAKSIIPVKVKKLKSFNGFYFDVKVNHIESELEKFN